MHTRIIIFGLAVSLLQIKHIVSHCGEKPLSPFGNEVKYECNAYFKICRRDWDSGIGGRLELPVYQRMGNPLPAMFNDGHVTISFSHPITTLDVPFGLFFSLI